MSQSQGFLADIKFLAYSCDCLNTPDISNNPQHFFSWFPLYSAIVYEHAGTLITFCSAFFWLYEFMSCVNKKARTNTMHHADLSERITLLISYITRCTKVTYITIINYTIYCDLGFIQFYLGKEWMQVCETLVYLYSVSKVLAFLLKYAN